MCDVVDFDVLLDRASLWKKAWREGVGDAVAGSGLESEQEKRRLGFWLMLKEVREQEGEDTGARVKSGAHWVEVMMGVLMFFLGVVLVRGLLTEFSYAGEHVIRGFNIWVFLAVTLGAQWCVLIVATIGYITRKKWSGVLGPVQRLLSSWIKKWGGVQMDKKVWDQVVGGTGRKLWVWRMTRMLQSGSIAYNAGIMAGLFGCLWFLNVSFFWETSLPQFGEQSLHKVTQVLSAPLGGKVVSPHDVVVTNTSYHLDTEKDIFSGSSMPPRMSSNLGWSSFFFIAIAIWGAGPRILLWLMTWRMERKVLAELDFQESRHRSLWREVTRVERGEVVTAPADGVVVLDVGGLEVSTESVRPYFLQVLRVNPESRFSLGTLDADGERRALDAAREAAMGVVFLVEGWNLSPKQMSVYHRKVREAIGDRHLIRYLVLDADDEELQQWIGFVDGLKDSESEVFSYQGT